MRFVARFAVIVIVVVGVTAATAHGWYGQKTVVHTHIRTWGGATPTSSSPVYGSPVYGSPVYGSPVYGSPVYGSPVYGSPVYGSPTYGSPTYGSPTYGCSGGSFGSPMYGSPMYGSPSFGCTGGNAGFFSQGFGNQGLIDPQGLMTWFKFFKDLQGTIGGGGTTPSDSKLLSRIEALEKKVDALKPSDLLPADYKEFKANTEQAFKGINAYLDRLDSKLDGIQGRLKVLENKTKNLKEQP